MPVSWKPRRQTIQDLIAEEEARIESLKQKEIPQWLPSVIEEPQWLTPEPIETEVPQWVQPPIQRQLKPSRLSFAPIEQIETPQTTPNVDVPQEETPEWWELPKVYGEGFMGKMGEAISKVPVLPKALQFVAPAFEFIQEKLEKPFAAFITSPWSPSLPWQAGESWLEHEKREYGAWKAPTYVKGLAEFAMPLWWVPWLGWATKGAKALGVGNKMAQALTKLAPKALTLPSKEVLNATLYKADFFKRLALWGENKPVLGGVVRAVGGPSAFVRDVGEVYPAMDIATRRLIAVNAKNIPVVVTDVVKREIVNRAVLMDMRHGYRGLQLPRMQKWGNPTEILQVDDFGRVMTATAKEGNKLGSGLSEVFENPDLYTYTSKEVEAIVREGNKILSELTELAAKEGVKVGKKPIFHRMVEGVERQLPDDKTWFETSEYGSRFEVQRHYKTMEEGIKAYADKGMKLVYGRDPVKSIGASVDYYFRKIGAKRFDDEVGKLGMTYPQMIALAEPELAEKIVELGTRIGSASVVNSTLKTLKSYGGKYIPGATMSKIKRGMPELGERIEQAFSVTPKEVDSIISALGREIRQVAKVNNLNLKVMLAQYMKTPGKILARDVDDMVRSLNVSEAVANKAVTRAYRAVYQSRKQFIDDTLKVVKEESEAIVKATKAELAPFKGQYNQMMRYYREAGGQIFGGLGKFTQVPIIGRHPSFRNRIFDREVVTMVESALGNKGQQWLRNMSAISGTGRMLIAAMDFSAPFIQGLAVLGRNPLAWAKGVGKQFEFFVKPQNLYKYLDDPVVKTIASERWFYGGSRSTFEYFEAMKPLQEVVGKIPKAGRLGQKALGQTYGRAEAAFTGFGEVARNEIWKSLRHKALKDGVFDDNIARELVRSIDRMTGVMSMEALAIGRTQIDFENAWVFFAPRYTRAGLSYVADVFKGGIAGAEARKSLGALAASGMAMYYGISTTLGQQPNLDPNSPRFLTVKIGNDYVGIGGILYALMRFGSNVVATAVEEPLDFVSLSRFDNPFIKFMSSRASPLTGAFTGIIEQKNFFGEPLENIGDWGKFLTEKTLPIAMQRAILEPEHRSPTLFVSELMGGRTFPKGAWELQEESRDAIARKDYGVTYDQLDLLSQKRIDKDPEVTKFQPEIDKQTTNRGKALSVAFLERQRELDDARFMHKYSVEQLQRAYDAGLIMGYDFREGVTESNYGYGATYEHINRNPKYAEALKKLEEPREVSRQYRWELAYDELMQATTSDMFEDQYGIFNYEAYSEFIEGLRRKYGDADFSKAVGMQREKYAEYPPLFQELQKAKDVMKPYWNVESEVIRLFGRAWAESSRGQSFITKQRKLLRLSNPEVARAYELFYRRE